ncbi:LOW QUALITY PROTEIN: uncharacterized protein LOC110189660 [Drosophila serrata]|uniref:LOW QUALITY PROTEIN: uncharacterized protein LOC110189660 n=1 Tax=Drosophila serrata TaxID=7274 RepID=UPI000A1D3446|nr:LOW QUALITY PROTEIN: uncharacterized protein LOC110189660 [Drosophila serrata]
MDSITQYPQPQVSLSSRNRPRWESNVASVDSKLLEPEMNDLQSKSLSTQVHFQMHHNLKEVTRADTRKVFTNIVSDMFDQMRGICQISESECSVHDALKESLSMDPRLKRWYDTLQNRAAVQAKIARQVGRRPDEMLINLPTTVAQRDRGTVERLLDMAGRMNPTVLASKQPAVLPAHPVCVEQEWKCLPEIQETLPRAERFGEVEVEVSGLTNATKGEIMGRTLQAPENRTQWLQSKVLDDRIEQQDEDIKRVLQFYPEVDSLEVVGAGWQEKLNETSRNLKQIERVSAESMVSISDTTVGGSEQEEDEGGQIVDATSNLDRNLDPDAELQKRPAARINGIMFYAGIRCSTPEVGHTYFECHPYENVVREVLVLENVGCHIITCQWIPYDPRRGAKGSGVHLEYFLMSRSMFVVFPGEKFVCRALFRPRGCALVKLRLELRVYPHILGSSRSHIVIRLTGRCVPPPEYTAKLQRQLNFVMDKAKQRITKDLAQHQASLVPLLKPHEVLCPYERIFDEREVFNAENPSYHCQRFDDLEALKALYHEVKKPREPAWDLRLETIHGAILRHPEAIQRRIQFAKFISIQEAMKPGADTRRPDPFDHNEERDRSRFIYVRGCIGNGIQEWEELMASMELSALRSEMTRYQAAQRDVKEKNGVDVAEDPEPKPWMRKLRHENLTLYLLKKLRSRKPYKDALYMQTYSQLCDLAEDVVSIIESTQYV